MIIANITSYIGQDMSAEHYYCGYQEINGSKFGIFYNGSLFKETELKRTLTSSSEIHDLNRKDHTTSWHHGAKLNRFLSIDQIHNELKKQVSDQNIITYQEGKIFKEMLCIINGTDHGVNYFGEVWIPVPTSCYSDLLPAKDTIKIKCGNCSATHIFDDVVEEKEWGGRKLIQFFKKSEVDEPCCKYYELEWNVIL